MKNYDKNSSDCVKKKAGGLRGSSGRSSGERKTALVFYEKGQGLWIQVVSPLVASVTGWLQLSLL